jgi:hypothetical protein
MSYIGQIEDEWEAKQAKKRATENARNKIACHICGKRLKMGQPISDHMKQVHKLKRAPTPVRTTNPEDWCPM